MIIVNSCSDCPCSFYADKMYCRVSKDELIIENPSVIYPDCPLLSGNYSIGVMENITKED